MKTQCFTRIVESWSYNMKTFFRRFGPPFIPSVLTENSSEA